MLKPLLSDHSTLSNLPKLFSRNLSILKSYFTSEIQQRDSNFCCHFEQCPIRKVENTIIIIIILLSVVYSDTDSRMCRVCTLSQSAHSTVFDVTFLPVDASLG